MGDGTVKQVREQIGKMSRKDKLTLAWDLFMVWVALINLWLILFDLTYLWARPVYLKAAPVVVRLYDPIKGIEPHPLTEEFQNEIQKTRTLLTRNPDSPRVPEQVQALRALSLRILQENPFERSGETSAHDLFLEDTAHYAETTADALRNPQRLRQAVTAVWPSDPRELRYRLDHFDPRLERALRLNYYRGFDRGGHLLDHFWKLDLPFLIVFWIEFMARWGLAIRRRMYARWFFFPIFNWYDVLGLLPTAYFRMFRLLRLVSVYMRLRRSELSTIGKGMFSKTVAYVSNILTEEVSDRVALRILNELEEEIASGTHVRIARSVIEPRKQDLEIMLVRELEGVVTRPETLEQIRGLLRLNLENAIEQSESLRSLPLPQVLVRPVVRTVGEVVVDTTLETVATTLGSADGREALQHVVGSVVDEVLEGPGISEAEALVREIVLQVIDHMKDVVAVKKWALPEDQRPRVPFPWEYQPDEEPE